MREHLVTGCSLTHTVGMSKRLVVGFDNETPEDQALAEAEVELREYADRRGMSIISKVHTKIIHDAEREAVDEYAVEVWADMV